MKVVIIGFGSIGQRHCKNLLEKSNAEIYLCTKHNLKNFKNSKRIQNLPSLEECLKNQPDSKFLECFNELVDYCKNQNIILLRTIGVVFSDQEKRITDYVG